MSSQSEDDKTPEARRVTVSAFQQLFDGGELDVDAQTYGLRRSSEHSESSEVTPVESSESEPEVSEIDTSSPNDVTSRDLQNIFGAKLEQGASDDSVDETDHTVEDDPESTNDRGDSTASETSVDSIDTASPDEALTSGMTIVGGEESESSHSERTEDADRDPWISDLKHAFQRESPAQGDADSPERISPETEGLGGHETPAERPNEIESPLSNDSPSSETTKQREDAPPSLEDQERPLERAAQISPFGGKGEPTDDEGDFEVVGHSEEATLGELADSMGQKAEGEPLMEMGETDGESVDEDRGEHDRDIEMTRSPEGRDRSESGHVSSESLEDEEMPSEREADGSEEHSGRPEDTSEFEERVEASDSEQSELRQSVESEINGELLDTSDHELRERNELASSTFESSSHAILGTGSAKRHGAPSERPPSELESPDPSTSSSASSDHLSDEISSEESASSSSQNELEAPDHQQGEISRREDLGDEDSGAPAVESGDLSRGETENPGSEQGEPSSRGALEHEDSAAPNGDPSSSSSLDASDTETGTNSDSVASVDELLESDEVALETDHGSRFPSDELEPWEEAEADRTREHDNIQGLLETGTESSDDAEPPHSKAIDLPSPRDVLGTSQSSTLESPSNSELEEVSVDSKQDPGRKADDAVASRSEFQHDDARNITSEAPPIYREDTQGVDAESEANYSLHEDSEQLIRPEENEAHEKRDRNQPRATFSRADTAERQPPPGHASPSRKSETSDEENMGSERDAPEANSTLSDASSQDRGMLGEELQARSLSEVSDDMSVESQEDQTVEVLSEMVRDVYQGAHSGHSRAHESASAISAISQSAANNSASVSAPLEASDSSEEGESSGDVPGAQMLQPIQPDNVESSSSSSTSQVGHPTEVVSQSPRAPLDRGLGSGGRVSSSLTSGALSLSDDEAVERRIEGLYQKWRRVLDELGRTPPMERREFTEQLREEFEQVRREHGVDRVEISVCVEDHMPRVIVTPARS